MRDVDPEGICRRQPPLPKWRRRGRWTNWWLTHATQVFTLRRYSCPEQGPELVRDGLPEGGRCPVLDRGDLAEWGPQVV
jgi:hypothetical protein